MAIFPEHSCFFKDCIYSVQVFSTAEELNKQITVTSRAYTYISSLAMFYSVSTIQFEFFYNIISLFQMFYSGTTDGGL